VANLRGGSLRCGVVIQMPLPRMTDAQMLAWRLREAIEYYARLAEKAAQKRSGPRSGRHQGGDGLLRVAMRKPGQSGLAGGGPGAGIRLQGPNQNPQHSNPFMTNALELKVGPIRQRFLRLAGLRRIAHNPAASHRSGQWRRSGSNPPRSFP